MAEDKLSKEEVKFRRVEASDYHKGLVLLLNQLTDSPEISEADFRAVLAAQKRNGEVTLVLEHPRSHRILSCGKVCFDHKFARNGGVAAHIEDIVVDSSLRGLGVGKTLIDSLVCEAMKNPRVYKVILDCADSVVGFYQSCGFELKGREMSKYRSRL